MQKSSYDKLQGYYDAPATRRFVIKPSVEMFDYFEAMYQAIKIDPVASKYFNVRSFRRFLEGCIFDRLLSFGQEYNNGLSKYNMFNAIDCKEV